MPNWFYFSVTVTGDEKDVEQFVENVKGSEKFETQGLEFDFNHFIPQPDNLFRGNLSMDKKKELDSQGLPNWYRWNNDNWGTKWNANCDFLDSEKNHAIYDLQTAWAFPNPVIHKMLDMYPNLDFIITGEEESNAYGVYIESSNEIWKEEEPDFVDECNDREVYWERDVHIWRYMDNDKDVEDSDNFYPSTKYSWS
jgi:hypothetical protein